MANHCRKQIRDAIVTALTPMSTVASIHTSRAHPLQTDALPALLIFTHSEDCVNLNHADDDARTLTLAIEGHAQDAAVVDTLDAIAKEAEPLVVAGLPVWVKSVELKSSSIELSGEAVQTIGRIIIEFAVVYHTNPAAPDAPL